ncbi:MAG: PBP1A family penicillin-binding protein [Prochloraceae cyanobacterium]|nr:PBP1A family penicillin-binding protein [Prochloraceae cyanobacterium]
MANQSRQTQISQVLTRAVERIHTRVNFAAIALKENARVPELWVKDGDGEKPKVYPLLGDKYIAGRSSKSCDIVVRNPEVSKIHFSLKKQEDELKRRFFTINDENSTNGIYRGKKRLKSWILRHGDILSLGPPELETSVEVEYHNPPPVWAKVLRYGLGGAGGIMGLLSLTIAWQWSRVAVKPIPEAVNAPVLVYAADGKTVLNPRSSSIHRELENLADFSPYLPNAVIASEDSRFYWHIGVDPVGILRAFQVNLKRDRISQGASTLTQQVARSLFPQVGRQNTIDRKLREMAVALKLEATYSKQEILKTYLNRVYLGVGNYGFEDAARFYFEKSAADLTLSEAATLVAILPAPNSYNPVQDYQTAVKFRNRVISRMLSQGMISKLEADRARRSRIEVSPKARETFANTVAPYYYAHVFTELRQLLGEELAKEGNFIVETGLDPILQAKAAATLKASVNADGSRYNFSQGAIVTLDSKTGAIKAMVGGVDYQKSQFNRATQAQRQPGSTFKVFAYTAALMRGISPYQTYSCTGMIWQAVRYKPCDRSQGNINMFAGLALSENVVALRIAKEAGLKNIVQLARQFGINSPLDPIPGLVIGQKEVNVLEITGAYGVFANRGVWNRPHAIKRILDSSDCSDPEDYTTCRAIYSVEEESDVTKKVIDDRIAATMNNMLQDVVRAGTGRAAFLGIGEAGKTGTTDRSVDLWFIGYVPQQNMVTGVWLGNDDNSPTRGSSSQAAALWKKYMERKDGDRL